jgi:hypothetical protein
MVPLSPVTVKDTVVEIADWLVDIVALDNWRLVTFPLSARSTIEPLSVVAFIVVFNGVGEGDGLDVGVGVGVGVAFGVLVGVGFDVGVDVGVGVEVGVGSGVGEGVGVGVGVEVGVGVGASVTVNELLVPELLPSVVIIVTPEPATITVTKVDPTPLTKAFILTGLIDPAE